MKILLIEDNESHAKMWELQYQSLGFPTPDLYRASTFHNAVEFLNRDKFDLIVLDMALPDKRGIPLLMAVQELAKGTEIQIFTGSNIPGLDAHVKKEPHVRLTLKNSSDLNAFREAIVPALPDTGETKAEIRNLWREMTDLKEEIRGFKKDWRNQSHQLRTEIDRAVNGAIIKLEDVNPDLQHVKEETAKLLLACEVMQSQLKETEQARLALKSIGWIATVINRYWRSILAVLTTAGLMPFIVNLLEALTR